MISLKTRFIGPGYRANSLILARSVSTTTVVWQNGEAKDFKYVPGPKSYPFVKNLFSLKKYGGHLNDTLPDLLFDLQKNYGNLVKFSIARKPEIYVFDPELIEKVITLNDKDPEKRKFEPWIMYFNILKKAQSLSNSDGPRWRRFRSSINLALARPQIVLKHIDSQSQIADDLVDFIRSEIDKNTAKNWVVMGNFEKTTRFLSLELISHAILNKKIVAVDDRLRTKETEDFAISTMDFALLLSQLLSSVPLWKIVSTPKWKKFTKTCDNFFNYVDQYVDEALKHVSTANNNSVLKHLHENKAKYELTDQDIKSEIAELFMGGIETEGTALQFALYQLGSDKKIRDQLYSEIKQNMKPGESIDEQVLSRMKYLKAFCKEVFRYFPIVSIYGRVIKQDMVLNGYKIPKGTFCNIVPVVVSKLDSVFDNANEFDPHRWIDPSKNYHPFGFLPFGHGSRSCAARRFAEQETYISILRLVQEFDIEYVGEPFKLTNSSFSIPDKPLRLKFTKRAD